MAYGVNPMIPHPDDRPRCITCGVKPKQITGKLYKDGSPRYRSECATCYRAKVAKKHGVINFTDVLAKNAGFSSGKEYQKHILQQAAKNAGFDSVKQYQKHIQMQAALNAGFDSLNEYQRHLRHQLALNAGFSSHAEYVAYQNQVAAEKAGFDSVTDWKNSKHPYRKYRKDYCENLDGRLGFECTTTIAWNGMLDMDHKNGKPWDNRPQNLQTLCKCCHAYKTNIFKDYATIGRKKGKEFMVA